MSSGGPERDDRGTRREDDLDELYGVAPEEFLARRKELAAAAKERGDAEGAKRIGASRRPTTAAWVVNVLVRRDPTVRPRLSELTDSLKEAHAAMDGPRIRELTAVQRKLIDGLMRAGLVAAGLKQPSAALRDDVVGTLQAAIADPDVAERLGRLEKAERWSGFGDFGSVTTVGAASTRPPESKAPSTEPVQPDDPAERERAEAGLAAARQRRATAASDVDAARAAHAEALDVVSERKIQLATARRRYEKLLESVDAAEQALNSADGEFEAAERTSRQAADRVDAATSELAHADSELSRLDANPPAP